MPKVVGVITARMASKRLPKKVLKEMSGKSIFSHHVERMRKIGCLDGVCLATSKDPANQEIIEEAKSLNCSWYAGAEQDVVDRHIGVCEQEKADAVLYVPCDSPLFDLESCSCFVEEFKKEYHDYIYVTNMTRIQGTMKELISHKALQEIHKEYHGPSATIHVVENIHKFKTLGLEVDPDLVRPEYRLTVDHPVDFELMNQVYKALYRGEPLSLRDVYVWLDDNPQIALINKDAEVSGFNKYVENLTDKHIYSVYKKGENGYVMDDKKQPISSQDFLQGILRLFPELREERDNH